MSASQWILIALAGVFAITAGFMMAAETALRLVSKARAEDMAERGLSGTQRLTHICADKAPYVNSVLFLRVLLEMASVAFVAVVIYDQIDVIWLEILVVVAIMTLVSFLLWGVMPRTLGRQHMEFVSRTAALPVSLITAVFGPITALLILIGNAITPGRGYTDGPFASEAELREMVDMAGASEVIEDDERRMIHSVFELGDTLVKEVMVPRTDMVVIEQTKTLRQAMSLALRSGFSRIPVIGADIDDVVGILYLKDLIRRVYDNPDSQTAQTVAEILRPAVWVPDSKPATDLMREMQLTRNHIVMVSDEFGGAAGLVSMEDILEEIVGEIVDEYDADVPPVTQLDDHSYRITSRMAIDDLGELFGIEDLDDEDVETVGGLMAKELNMVPIAGSVVRWRGLEFTAERAINRRNNQRTVLVTWADPEVDPADQSAYTAVASYRKEISAAHEQSGEGKEHCHDSN